MMHYATSPFDSAPRAGFGLLGGSWVACLQYPRSIAFEGLNGRMSVLGHQRLDAVSNTGAGFDHGGRTP